jgi:very-short-patch-repair endonuclease
MSELTAWVDLIGCTAKAVSVPRRHTVPERLRSTAFTVEEAGRQGVTPRQLEGSSYRRLGPGLYRWVDLEESPLLTLTAVARRLPDGAAFSGWTAAWLHGLDVEPCKPIEVTEPSGNGRRVGARQRRAALACEEIVRRRLLPATSPLRTVVDLGRRDPITEGVLAADMFLYSRLVSIKRLRAYVAVHAGAKGISRLRRVVELAEPKTESAMETRLRMLLVLAGLPRPQAQVPLCDNEGRWLGRPDLLYRDQRLAIEFDGGNHRDRLVDDNRRQNRLIKAGYRLLRFTAADVYRGPESVVDQVRELGRFDGADQFCK